MSIVSPEGQAAGLSFAQASPLLRHQALASARQILGAVYYSIAEAQWHQALEELQLPLYRLGDGPASLSAEGLLALLQYLEARYRLSSTATPGAGPTPPPYRQLNLSSRPTRSTPTSPRNWDASATGAGSPAAAWLTKRSRSC